MDPLQSRESDLDIDLESGGTTSEEDGCNNCDLTAETSSKKLHKVWSGFLGVQSSNGLASKQDGLNTYNKVMSADELNDRCAHVWLNKAGEQMENLKNNKMDTDKTKKMKPPKPPRPPKGPSLDAADVKFVKEISEIAIWKRRRSERIKALKKMKKESKSSSTKTNIFAMVITVVFFLIILFQGVLGSQV